MQTRSRTGFTLLEMLVALAILSLLAALLFPVFARAREKARQAACASNLRQIGIATMQYLQDNDETMFPKPYDDAAGGNVQWDFYTTPGPNKNIDESRGMLGFYLKNNIVWVCPSAPSEQLGTTIATPYPSYGLSLVLTGTRLHPAPAIAQVQMPAETVLTADSGNPHLGPRLLPAGYILPPSRHKPFVCGRHSDMAEVLWLDGHVNTRKPITDDQAKDFIDIATQEQYHLGNLLKGPYTGNDALDDYYYDLVKP